ncbi:MAG: site-specific integrase [Solirubrobacterales bacterium]|nr:site-specific integrase [Solirubrobacterales bacterium]
MSVHQKTTPSGERRYVVRWREGARNRSRAFRRKKDAVAYDAEVTRRRQLGPIALQTLDAGRETLDEFAMGSWATSRRVALAPSTVRLYASLYDTHIAPYLGSVPLRELTPDRISTWQAERVDAGAGREVIRKAHTLIGNVLQRAVESGRIATNPQRVVRKVKSAQRTETRPLAPASVEAMRSFLLANRGVDKRGRAFRVTDQPERDATLLSVLAYAGLRPGEALTMTWGNVGDRTLTINASKTGQRRSVRVLTPLAVDLAAWKLLALDTSVGALVFPGVDGASWTLAAQENWGRRAFSKAADAAGRPDTTPYTARHSFASMLLHEGRSVIYVARQLGHGANLTLSTYGHVIEELDGAPQIDAQDAIWAARGEDVPSEFPRLVSVA